jgi:iron complex transport system permease protein
VCAFFTLELLFGSVILQAREVLNVLTGRPVDAEKEYVREILVLSRIPRALTSLVAGASLALCGLLMQTFFRNPLAGPSVLGVSSGASLGVTLAIAGSGGLGFALGSFFESLAISFAAMLGAFAIMAAILAVAMRLRDNASLLIFGLMLGYLCSSLIILVEYGASKEALRGMIVWGMGSFAVAGKDGIMIMALATAGLYIWCSLNARHFNIMLLGEDYSQSMGLNYRRMRIALLTAAGAAAGIITAFCGPVAFLGLSVPHLARALFRTANHRILVPATALAGALIALGCDLISRLPGSADTLPLNAVTSMVGAPVVIYLLVQGVRMKHWF